MAVHHRGTRRPAALAVAALLAAAVGVGAPAATGAPSSTARRHDHAPTAPEHLTVDGRVAPLAVQDTPQLGWLPQDRDGGEIQTAYEVQVRRGGHRVWDSGRVRSSHESWVSYGGPALDPGATYTWTVRTWDRDGVVSPYARAASFGTGLGDGDWSGAQWIRRQASGNDASNEYTVARKVLQVSSGSPVVRARAYVAATGDWALDVDGHQVQRSSSYGYPGEGYYDVAALQHVRAGKPLAVGVLSHYWSCRCQGRANGPNAPEGPSGMLAKVVVDHADGSRDVMVSDGSWKVHRYEPQRVDTLTYRNGDAGDRVEYYDATHEMPGWDTASYDAADWTAPVVVGPHPRPQAASCTTFEGSSSPCTQTHLVAAQAHVSYRVVHPVSVRNLPDGTVFADFGKVYASRPRLALSQGRAGRQVTVTTSYRRANTTLAAVVARGDRQVTLADAAKVHVGDRLVVDAPADGYGAGHPEAHSVTAVTGAAVTLATPLRRRHAAGAWVETSRAGTSKLDTQGSDLRYLYTEKDGAQVAEPFTYWGWRYLQVDAAGQRLTRRDIAAVVQQTDAPAYGSADFSSSDPTLDRVFRLMQRSALQSSQNVFLDTPTREKGQFLGDAVDESFATMTASGERSLTRQAIVDFMHSQDRYWTNGAMNSVYPNGDAKRDIPDYTEMFPEWVMRYYETTGDKVLLRQALPAMQRVADYISASVAADGLVTDLAGGSGPYLHGIIDWPSPMRYGYVVDGNAARTVVNSLAVGAFRSVSEAAHALGDAGVAGTYGDRADTLSRAMTDQLVDPATGHWVDGLDGDGHRIDSTQQHSQTYPVVYGVEPASGRRALGRLIASQGMQHGPMDLRQLLEALRLAGRPAAMVHLLTDPTSDGPAQVLAEGGTFMWEQWTPGCAQSTCTGPEVDQTSSESMSHGWGGAGVVGVLEGLLGVTVTSPGAATVRIAPPDAGLRHAAGTQWTERGPVTVRWTRTAHGFRADVDVPVNVRATVALPAARGARTRLDGSARRTGTHQGRAVFAVGSGHTRLTVTDPRGRH